MKGIRYNGEIVKISSSLGFIEYDKDQKVSYVFKEYKDFNIGDEINFELNFKSVTQERTSPLKEQLI